MMTDTNNLKKHGIKIINGAKYALPIFLLASVCLAFYSPMTWGGAAYAVGCGLVLSVIYYYYWSNGNPILFFIGIILIIPKEFLLSEQTTGTTYLLGLIHYLSMVASGAYTSIYTFRNVYIKKLSC